MKADSRSERKVARRIAAVAYERELTQELAKLHDQFDRWRQGQLSAFDLSNVIHEFHNGAARDLFVVYNRLQPTHAVARAVALGIVLRAEVPPELLASLAGAIEFYSIESQPPNETEAWS